MTDKLCVGSVLALPTIETGIALTIVYIDGAIHTLPSEWAVALIRQEVLRFKVDALWNHSLSASSAVLTGLRIARVGSV